MKMLKSYNFWIRLVAVVVLLLRVVGSEFGFSVDSGLIIDIATAVASVLVVLGVIQVPVDNVSTLSKDNENNIGGEFMKSYEQIKQDLKLAKDKLLTNFENNETMIEITKILDDIFGTDFVETIEEELSEVKPIELNTIEIENGNIDPPVKTEVTSEPDDIESVIMESLAEKEYVEESEVSSEEAESVDIAEPANTETEETERKIKEVLRAKLMEILDRDLDDIITQIS